MFCACTLHTHVRSIVDQIIVFIFTSSQLGRTSFPMIFDFGDFQIGRKISMTVEDPSALALTPDAGSLSPRRMAGGMNRRDRLKGLYTESKACEGWVVPGQRLAR